MTVSMRANVMKAFHVNKLTPSGCTRRDLLNLSITSVDTSRGIVSFNLGYIEKCAKEEAGYNAAFRYHCTYGNVNSGCDYLGEEESLEERRPR